MNYKTKKCLKNKTKFERQNLNKKHLFKEEMNNIIYYNGGNM